MTTKSSESEQLCRIGFPGGAGSPTPAATKTTQATSPLADQYGRLIVVVDGTVATTGGSGPVTTDHYLAKYAGLTSNQFPIPVPTPGLIAAITKLVGFNGTGIPCWIQIHDSPVFPLDGTTEASFSQAVAANYGTFDIGISVSDIDNICVIALSSNPVAFIEPPVVGLGFACRYILA